MSEIIRTLFTSDKIERRTKEVAADIVKDYRSQPLHLISVLRGSVPFYCKLQWALYDLGVTDITSDFVKLTSYEGTSSSGKVRDVLGLSDAIAGRNVLVVEDIIDTGWTLQFLLQRLQQQAPKSLRTCCLLDKPCRREIKLEADYVGFTIPNQFVVGYGLDYEQRYRELPYIAVIQP